MTVALKRGQIGKVRGDRLLDVTVKSATGWAAAFAPTWEMVSGHKDGTMGDAEYRERYEAILDASGDAFDRLRQLGAEGPVKLLCYCPDGRFCHTHLMIDYAIKKHPQWFSDGRVRQTTSKKRIGGRMKYLLAVDLETTGLKPGYHEITQIAGIMLNKSLDELGSFETFVRIDCPERGLENDFNVFEYTGIKVEDLKKAPLLRDALRSLETFVRSKIGSTDLRQVIVFGQNPAFDKGFLEEGFERQGWKFPFDFHVLALESMFIHHHLLRTGELPADIGLKDICKVAGVENRQKHNAMSDIRATVDSLHKLCPAKQPKAAKLAAGLTDDLRDALDFDAGEPPAKPVPRRRNVRGKQG